MKRRNLMFGIFTKPTLLPPRNVTGSGNKISYENENHYWSSPPSSNPAKDGQEALSDSSNNLSSVFSEATHKNLEEGWDIISGEDIKKIILDEFNEKEKKLLNNFNTQATEAKETIKERYSGFINIKKEYEKISTYDKILNTELFDNEMNDDREKFINNLSLSQYSKKNFEKFSTTEKNGKPILIVHFANGEHFRFSGRGSDGMEFRGPFLQETIEKNHFNNLEQLLNMGIEAGPKKIAIHNCSLFMLEAVDNYEHISKEALLDISRLLLEGTEVSLKAMDIEPKDIVDEISRKLHNRKLKEGTDFVLSQIDNDAKEPKETVLNTAKDILKRPENSLHIMDIKPEDIIDNISQKLDALQAKTDI